MGIVDLEFGLGVSVFALRGWMNFASESVDNELQAIADAEDGNAEVEDFLVGMRRAIVVDGGWSARQNNADGRVTANFIELDVEGKDYREDLIFADAARDELRILRAEVENNDGLSFHG